MVLTKYFAILMFPRNNPFEIRVLVLCYLEERYRSGRSEERLRNWHMEQLDSVNLEQKTYLFPGHGLVWASLHWHCRRASFTGNLFFSLTTTFLLCAVYMNSATWGR